MPQIKQANTSSTARKNQQLTKTVLALPRKLEQENLVSEHGSFDIYNMMKHGESGEVSLVAASAAAISPRQDSEAAQIEEYKAPMHPNMTVRKFRTPVKATADRRPFLSATKMTQAQGSKVVTTHRN